MKRWIAVFLIALCALACAATLADEKQPSSLPFLSIVTDSGELPGDEMLYGHMTLVQDGAERTVRIGLRERGSPAAASPRKATGW